MKYQCIFLLTGCNIDHIINLQKYCTNENGKVSFQYLIILAETDIDDQDNQTYFIRLKKKYDYCNIVSLFKHYSYSLAHDANKSNQRKMMSKVKK